ncbi:hypothetical protein BDV12DRAFT_203107 [Aspergillus spectabilis]
MSHYAMTKAALSTFAERLHKEVSPFGIRAVAFDLGGYPTHLLQPRDDSPQPATSPTIEAYKLLLGEVIGMVSTSPVDLMPRDRTNDSGLPLIRFICISDTHIKTPSLPPDDTLVRTGDLTVNGTFEEVQAKLGWFCSQPHPHKIASPHYM